MEGPPEWKRWGRGSPAGRRVRAFEGWGLVVPQEEWGGGRPAEAAKWGAENWR